MATITGLTKEKMLEIQDATVISGEIRADGHLWLTTYGGEPVGGIDCGPVIGPPGPTGPMGPAAVSAVPGEIRMWSGSTLPAIGSYGRWVWANGAIYPVASHPIAAAHIASQWRTAHGASDPGGSNFRVPDVRGLVPAGLDQMPGDASRANRLTRSVAILIAGKTGVETHVIAISEVPIHNHGGTVNVGVNVNVSGGVSGTTDGGGHDAHTMSGASNNVGVSGPGAYQVGANNHNHEIGNAGSHAHNFSGGFSGSGSGSGSGSIPNQGGGGSHENVQPTVFVPYIVYLDG